MTASVCAGQEPLAALGVGSPFEDAAYDLLRSPLGARQEEDAEGADHPLLPVLQFAYETYLRTQADVRDYRCTLIKRERVRSRLQSHEHIQVKLRHRQVDDGREAAPFSVYLKFLGPAKVEGREVVYVQGKNNGHLVATKGGSSASRTATLSVDPQGPWGMDGNRYPITELGMLNLTGRLIEEGVHYMQADAAGQCRVDDIEGAEINDRRCRYIRVTFPTRRRQLKFHVAEIFIDEELHVPVRYAAYDWPDEDGDEPKLLEEYTYLDIDWNVGLTDLDFERTNPAYRFTVPKRR
jgi:hypothetical protein